VFEAYKAALSRTNPPDRVQAMLGNEWFHNAVFYPNMFMQLRALFIRVIRPIAVDHTEVNVYPIRLKGAPEEMFRRVQGGLQNGGAEWVVLGRGRHAEHADFGGFRAPGTSERSMRTQYRAWKRHMAPPA
jgi:benzoate/toluate 1,2-dioxygenase alpha subunit